MNINKFMINMDNMSRSDRFEVELFGPPGTGIRSRGIRCTSVSIPAKSVAVVTNSYLSAGPKTSYADMIDYGGSVDLTFMLDHTYEDRQKIELWQSFIYDDAYSLQYPDKYFGAIKIRQLGVDGFPIYEVELHQCFPSVINDLTFDSTASQEIQTFSTNFVYRSWSSSFENTPSGLLGGLFNKVSKKITGKINKKISDKLFG